MMKTLFATLMLLALSVILTPAASAGPSDCPWANPHVNTDYDYACSDQSDNGDPVGYMRYCVAKAFENGVHLDYLLIWCPTKVLN